MSDVFQLLRELLEGHGVELKSGGGGRLKGLCPLHAEKTPSFLLYPDGRYYCFGCGEGGDAIDLVRRLHGLSYPDALRFLGLSGPKPTAAALQRIKAERMAREDAAWREREVARTLGIAIRRCHEALQRITPDTLDDHTLILQSLPVIEYQHQTLIDGTPADKAAVVAEWRGVRLFTRTLLFRKNFDFRAWVRRVNEPQPLVQVAQEPQKHEQARAKISVVRV